MYCVKALNFFTLKVLSVELFWSIETWIAWFLAFSLSKFFLKLNLFVFFIGEDVKVDNPADNPKDIRSTILRTLALSCQL